MCLKQAGQEIKDRESRRKEREGERRERDV